ncbi:LysR family transcriptional regulator [Streptomyces sp. NPDC052396]|uniref:LysR family transcriptional regulator n=1 Tax=Streptomyces sp. NPDC052396 TaxID=3365689 RepID=UPI0037D127DE
MESLDLNLLAALDALLTEESVTGAAARLNTSAPAMSRTLGRLRRALGDPLLVRAGRRMVPTPRALELRGEARELTERTRALFADDAAPDPAALHRRFTLQAGDMLLAALAAPLTALIGRRAPGVTLCFLPESLEGGSSLRDGRVDLELGVIEHTDPETRVAPLGETRLVAAVRGGHPLTAAGPVTAAAFAAAEHISVSRRGRAHGPIDRRLAELGLRRRVPAVVPSYTAGLFLAAATDLVCLTPATLARHCPEALGMHTFPVPLDLPPLSVGMAWHPRNDADGAQRWLRAQVREVFGALPDTDALTPSAPPLTPPAAE